MIHDTTRYVNESHAADLYPLFTSGNHCVSVQMQLMHLNSRTYPAGYFLRIFRLPRIVDRTDSDAFVQLDRTGLSHYRLWWNE